jgi:hypothetical protein
MTVRKVRVLLTARRGATALGRALEAAVNKASAAFGVAIAWGTRTPGDPIEGSAHGEAIGPAPEGFEAMVEAAGDGSFPFLIDALAPIIDAVAEEADLARSTVIAGEHHLLAPNTGPYMMVFALRRPAGMSREAFFDYWANRHGPMITKGFGSRGSYYQLHGDDEATRAAATRFGVGVADFDGHAGGWLRDPSVLGVSMRHEQAAAALDDERRFIEHSRSMLMVYALGAA